MRTPLVLVLVVVALLATPSGALAQGAFDDTPLPPPTQSPAPTPAPLNDPNGDDIGRKTLYLMGAALLVSFAGIGWWITRDARQSLPPEDRRAAELREEGPHRKGREAKAKARAKGRAAKAARRQSRSRR